MKYRNGENEISYFTNPSTKDSIYTIFLLVKMNQKHVDFWFAIILEA